VTKVLIDTNILVSAALFPQSVPAQAYMKAVMPPHEAIVCDYSVDEFRRVFNIKFSHRLQDYDRFISAMALAVSIVSAPVEGQYEEDANKIRDIYDRPIFRAAVAAKTDVLLTGDKDFLEADIKTLKIITAAEFLRMV
jgi:putative PIN family toxin of toxin-antitoxin system